MTIQEKIEYNIDQIQDDVDFKMFLFNEGKYDKEHLRTIIRNTGLKLTVENKLGGSLTIENIYLGIFNNDNLTKLYTSFGLSKILPITLNSFEKVSVCFYGWDVKEKFQEFQGEKGMFICTIPNSNKSYHSSKFDGDNVEEKLKYLEDEEIANWGSPDYYYFDVESKL